MSRRILTHNENNDRFHLTYNFLTVKVISAHRWFMLPTVLGRWSWCNSSCFVWRCGFSYELFNVESYLAPCSHAFSVLFGIVSKTIGEESWFYMLLAHVYAYFECLKLLSFCFFSSCFCRVLLRLVLLFTVQFILLGFFFFLFFFYVFFAL